jgi:nitrate/nitrite transporter NarK
MNLGRSIQQFLSIIIMMTVFFVIFYMDISILYKIFMAVLAFAIVFLLGLADKTVEQIENRQPEKP